MSQSFTVRLHNVLKDFHLQEAETLSDVLHQAEQEGVELTPSQERLWLKLTERIQEERSRG